MTTNESNELTLKRVDRDEFTAVDLTIDDREAEEIVEERLKGLSAAETDQGIKLRTTDGRLIAILVEHELPSGEQGTRLEYRTAPAGDISTRKAHKIRAALDPYEA